MSFFEELKRRNVIRVGIAYIVVAWLLLQMTDVLIELLELPGTAGKYIILLLLVGFPLALFFAWAFEMTPEGIKREAEVDRSQSITQNTGRKLDRSIIAVLVVALAIFAYDKFFSGDAEPGAIDPAKIQAAAAVPQPLTAEEPSIAVLPFLNMSNDPEQEYFSDGISEELLNLLVRVEGLKVASRTSSFIYKGENLNIPAIAAEMKVNHILEGSVRKAGNRVRITAQLIDVSTDRHLWSDTFDRELLDIFAIQDEIANAIVEALKAELSIGLQNIDVETATENLDAYDSYLKARGLFLARQDLAQSIALFKQATELDPEFAQAWEGLAAAHSVSGGWLAGDGVDHNALAHAAALKALEVDPDLSIPYAVIGMDTNSDFLGAIENLDKAVANDPKNATARLWRAIRLAEAGYTQRAIADYQECLALDPGYLNCKQHMAVAFLQDGNSELAIRNLEETLAENFHSTDHAFVSHYVTAGQRISALLMAVVVSGDYAPVKDWVEAIENPLSDHSNRIARWVKWTDANNYDICFMDELAIALRLDRCYESSEYRGIGMVWHPDAAYFRNTPAFKKLVNKDLMRLWRKQGFPPRCRPLAGDDFECD